MSLSIEEQETHVNFSRGDERAEVYVSDTTMMTKLDKLVKLAGTEWRLERVSKIKSEIVGKNILVRYLLYRFGQRGFRESIQTSSAKQWLTECVLYVLAFLVKQASLFMKFKPIQCELLA